MYMYNPAKCTGVPCTNLLCCAGVLGVPNWLLASTFLCGSAVLCLRLRSDVVSFNRSRRLADAETKHIGMVNLVQYSQNMVPASSSYRSMLNHCGSS